MSYFSRYSAMAILMWWLIGLPPFRLEKVFSCSSWTSSNLKPTAIFLDIVFYHKFKKKHHRPSTYTSQQNCSTYKLFYIIYIMIYFVIQMICFTPHIQVLNIPRIFKSGSNQFLWKMWLCQRSVNNKKTRNDH